jgi:hypothetical protein
MLRFRDSPIFKRAERAERDLNALCVIDADCHRAKAPPQMAKSANNPNDLSMSTESARVAASARSSIWIQAGAFWGFKGPNAKVMQGLVQDFWRHVMAGRIKGQ